MQCATPGRGYGVLLAPAICEGPQPPELPVHGGVTGDLARKSALALDAQLYGRVVDKPDSGERLGRKDRVRRV